MSQGLEKLAGSKLELILKKMTSHPLKSLFLGVGITTVIQSSSAVTVMLVGLVNSGLMDLGNTVGVIMGSNIGTTVTAWILSLVGIQGDNIFVKLLKPESFSPILAFIGILMTMIAKSEKKKDVGTILIGFAILMYGMEFMSGAVKPLSNSPDFTSIITAFTNPLLGVLAGLVLTAIIQSSSASVGILQALSLTGQITYGVAIPIIMGQNIGTCVTALISSIGVNKNAKRVAVIHILFNLIGTAIFMTIYCICFYAIDLTIIEKQAGPVGIAICHSIFNIGTSLLLLPFSNWLVKIAKKTIKTGAPKKEASFLDERILATPAIALTESVSKTVDMARITEESVHKAVELLHQFDEEKVKQIYELEKEVDKYEDRLGNYLVKLSACDLTEQDRVQISKLLHSIGDFERISDHAANLSEVAKEMKEKNTKFSEAAYKELDVLTKAVKAVVELTVDVFENSDGDAAYKIEPLEEVIDDLVETIKLNHVKRLQKGNCTIVQGFIMSDILTNYERISDHCSNIALGIIEISKTSFESHAYVNKLVSSDDPKFRRYFNEFKEKYSIVN